MSEAPIGAAGETEPAVQKKNNSGFVGLIVILVIAWFVWAWMRVPEAARLILDLDENAQQALILTDGQGQGGLAVSAEGSDAAAKAKAAKSDPIPVGRKNVWYTLYPDINVDEKVKTQVKDPSFGWTLKDASEGVYTWRGRYDVKLKAPLTTDGYPFGLQFYEHDLGIGEKIGLMFRNLLP